MYCNYRNLNLIIPGFHLTWKESHRKNGLSKLKDLSVWIWINWVTLSKLQVSYQKDKNFIIFWTDKYKIIEHNAKFMIRALWMPIYTLWIILYIYLLSCGCYWDWLAIWFLFSPSFLENNQHPSLVVMMVEEMETHEKDS